MVREGLGELLVKQGVITQQTLTGLYDLQEREHARIHRLLLDKKLATGADIARAYSTLLSLSYVDTITDEMVDPKLLGKVSLKFLRSSLVIPLTFQGRQVILTSDPYDLGPIDELVMSLGIPSTIVVGAEEQILEAINKYYPFETGSEMMDELSDADDEEEFDLTSVEERDIMEMANDAPIVKLVNHVIFQAVKEGASDIHIEPFEKELSIRYRIDGVMYQRMMPPKRYQAAIVSRVKIMSNLNIAEKRLPQDSRIQLRVADKAIDLRISVLPCNYGERVVMRILDKSKGGAQLEELDLAPKTSEIIHRVIERPNGIILVSGPTGSGKTTTLYSILRKLNRPETNIITIEDPVEYTVQGINQVQVHEKIGLSFASALRSILRQDPDVLLIGEIRDGETARIATQSSLTGHLVLSTIHTNSAPSSVTRLIDMGVEPFLVSSTLACVISQRLVRRLCEHCKKAYKPPARLVERLGLSAAKAAKITFYQADGCDKCFNNGYRGRVALFEVMEVTDELAALIIDRADAGAIKQQALRDGMVQLIDDGVRLIMSGTTTVEEILSVAYADG